VIRGFGVIQGDGINLKTLKEILDAALKKGYSAENCVFGMGGGLLQKVNRDTMSFATKLNHIIYEDGTARFFPFLSFPFLSFPFLSFPFLFFFSFLFLSCLVFAPSTALFGFLLVHTFL